MIKEGGQVMSIQLPSTSGELFDSSELKGPHLLSFFRFATCPFCNLRMRNLIQSASHFGDEFSVIAIFDSQIDHLAKHAKRQNAQFHILADAENEYYRKFNIRHSVLGVIKGMIFRFPTLIKSMSMGHFPFPIKGSLTTMPADFLIDERGIIQKVFYGADEGDHLPITEIISFSNK